MDKGIDMNPGDKVYVQREYRLEPATVVSARGAKTVLVELDYPEGYRTRVKREKVAAPEDSIALMWEMWRGVNGRGGYRLERELYPELRKPAKDWDWCSYVWEKEHGKLHGHITP